MKKTMLGLATAVMLASGIANAADFKLTVPLV